MKKLIGSTLFILGLTSCDSTIFEYPEYAMGSKIVRVGVDWSKYRIETPTGMTVMVFPQSGGDRKELSTNNIDYADFVLDKGTYDIAVMNQSPGEYSSVSFSGMNSYHTAEAHSVEARSKWFVSRVQGSTRVISQPAHIAMGRRPDFVVTDTLPDYTQPTDTRTVATTVTPVNIIYTVYVTVHVKNIRGLRSVRGSIDGIAEGHKFSEPKPNNETVALLLENWALATEGDNPNNGVLTTSFTCFGLPGNRKGLPDENMLKMSFLMADESVAERAELVGDKFRWKQNGGEAEASLDIDLDIDLGEPLPTIETIGGGFDIGLTDWGDAIVVELN